MSLSILCELFKEWEEMTICDYCHNSITSDLYHSKGWTHDDEDEEEES